MAPEVGMGYSIMKRGAGSVLEILEGGPIGLPVSSNGTKEQKYFQILCMVICQSCQSTGTFRKRKHFAGRGCEGDSAFDFDF